MVSRADGNPVEAEMRGHGAASSWNGLFLGGAIAAALTLLMTILPIVLAQPMVSTAC